MTRGNASAAAIDRAVTITLALDVPYASRSTCTFPTPARTNAAKTQITPPVFRPSRSDTAQTTTDAYMNVTRPPGIMAIDGRDVTRCCTAPKINHRTRPGTIDRTA